MIAKLKTIAYTDKALSYCEKGGDLIFSNECLGNANDIFNQMKITQAMNDRCSKKSFHSKIRIAPEDQGKLNIDDWITIANKYAKKIGFDSNQFAVYLHEENSFKEHIHIVASRITEQNKAVSNSYTNYKNMDFCRVIEDEYGLRKVERKLEFLKKGIPFSSNDKRQSSLKELLLLTLEKSKNLDEFATILKRNKVKTKIGRGINFTDAKGVNYKGSAIDRKLSLSHIRKQLKLNIDNQSELKIR